MSLVYEASSISEGWRVVICNIQRRDDVLVLRRSNSSAEN